MISFINLATVWQVVYLARVPFLILLLIASFMPIALFSPFKVFIENLYDLNGFWQNFWFALFALLLAFTVVTTIKITLIYGGERIGFGAEDRWLRRRLIRWISFDFQGATAARFERRTGRAIRIFPAPNSVFFTTAVLFAVIMLSGVFVFPPQQLAAESFRKLVGQLCGFAAAMVILLLADLLHRACNPPQGIARLPNFLFPYSLFPLRSPWFRWLGWLRDRAGRSELLPKIYNAPAAMFYRPRFVEDRLIKTPRYFGRGYLQYDFAGRVRVTGEDAGRRALFLSGYSLAMTMFFFFFALYLLIGYNGVLGIFLYKLTNLEFLANISKYNDITAISYVMLLLTVLCWSVSALTFAFDRFRVPALLVVVLLLAFASWFSGTDHFYSTRDLTLDERSEIQSIDYSPYKVFTARLPAPTTSPTPTPICPPAAVSPTPSPSPSKKPYVILVAADGGGIQAAAWTARVLTGIEQQCREQFKDDKDFQGCAKRIRLISSVSGGSVGAMYFVNAYTPETASGLPEGKDGNGRDLLDKIVRQAETSSLNQVAWGFTYPDFARSIVPFRLFDTGRGQALEEAWVRQDCNDIKAQTRREGCSLDQNLFKWREGVRNGWRPANIFNATIVETGERLMIGTTDVCANEKECAERMRSNNNDCLKPEDITTETSQSNKKPCPDYKTIVDGRWSFYDLLSEKDVAVSTAVRLSAGFPYVSPAARADSDGSPKHRYHIVDGGYYDNYGVASLLEWLDEALKNGGDEVVQNVLIVQIRANKSVSSKGSGQIGNVGGAGWYYQIAAPLTAVMNARVTGQLSHNEIELEMFQRYWRERNTGKSVNIQTAVFQYDGDKSSPLSWHLTNLQKENIETAWKKILDRKDDKNDKENGWRIFSSFVAAMNPRDGAVR